MLPHQNVVFSYTNSDDLFHKQSRVTFALNSCVDPLTLLAITLPSLVTGLLFVMHMFQKHFINIFQSPGKKLTGTSALPCPDLLCT